MQASSSATRSRGSSRLQSASGGPEGIGYPIASAATWRIGEVDGKGVCSCLSERFVLYTELVCDPSPSMSRLGESDSCATLYTGGLVCVFDVLPFLSTAFSDGRRIRLSVCPIGCSARASQCALCRYSFLTRVQACLSSHSLRVHLRHALLRVVTIHGHGRSLAPMARVVLDDTSRSRRYEGVETRLNTSVETQPP